MRAIFVTCFMLIASATFAGDFNDPSDAPQMALEQCGPINYTDAVHWCMMMEGFYFVCPKKTRENVYRWQCWRFDPRSTRD